MNSTPNSRANSLSSVNKITSLPGGFAGPALRDLRRKQERFRTDPTAFTTLRFTHQRETVDTELIAYLLRPSETHGQGTKFLKSFLEALGLPISDDRYLKQAVIRTNVPTVHLERRSDQRPRYLDLIIELPRQVVVIENKSRGAKPGAQQVPDYLDEIRQLYPHLDPPPSLFYLVAAKEQQRATKLFLDLERVRVVCFEQVISRWMKDASHDCESEHVRWFLHDVETFLTGEHEREELLKGNEVTKHVKEIVTGAADTAQQSGNDNFETLLAIYDSHPVFWQSVLREFSKNLEKAVKKRFAADGYEITGSIEPIDGSRLSWCLLHLRHRDWPKKDEKLYYPSYAFMIDACDLPNRPIARFKAFVGIDGKPASSPSFIKPDSRKSTQKGWYWRVPYGEKVDFISSEGVKRLLSQQEAESIAEELEELQQQYDPSIRKFLGLKPI